MRRANPRIYLGPDTREIIIPLRRTFGVSFNTSNPDITLKLSRRTCSKTPCEKQGDFEWSAYSLSEKGEAHFEVPEELTVDADGFPRGFYDAKVFINDCHASDIEIIKAPGYYANDARTNETNGDCDTGKWAEPECKDTGCKPESKRAPCPNEDSKGGCGCEHKDSCPSCLTTYEVQKINFSKGYMG